MQNDIPPPDTRGQAGLREDNVVNNPAEREARFNTAFGRIKDSQRYRWKSQDNGRGYRGRVGRYEWNHSHYNSNMTNFDRYRKNFFVADKRKRRVCCVNCGKEGHVVKDCKDPITSFGIIAIRKRTDDVHIGPVKEIPRVRCSTHSTSYPEILPLPEDGSNILYLMVQRKDTMGYMDLIRGKPDEFQKRKLLVKTYLEEMTCEERARLAKYANKFEALWEMIWMSQGKHYWKDFLDAKQKFEKLNITKLLQTTECKWTEQEYGFPKGRKNVYESNLDCAIREFCEESGYTTNDIKILDDRPLEEVFVGTNGISYRHIYYIAKVSSKAGLPKIDTEDPHQFGEISNCGWFTYEQCMKIIRPYDTAKKELLTHIHHSTTAK